MTVSVPAVASASETDGLVQVCATRSALEEPMRNFQIMLSTSNDTGKWNKDAE